MGDLIDTTEMYLRTIFELEEEGIPPLRARIAERLKQSGPTVSETVARMERDGLVRVHSDRRLELSRAGRARAAEVMRRHRLAERLLTDVIGLDWALVHDEACRWEHVISTDVERRLVTVLGVPTRSPYGNPIPGLDELGASVPEERFLDGTQVLAAKLASGGVHEVRVMRISEGIQAQPEVLARLADAGMLPGAPVQAQFRAGRLEVESATGRALLSPAVADHIFIALD